MKAYKPFLFILIFLCFFKVSLANDGAYFTSGNQLIPIIESDISIRKEILKLKKINNNRIEVSVYYEFFNPGDAKEITVGFEAFAPEGDVDGKPINGNHPYMHDFTVKVNDKDLKYQVAYVKDSLYAANGIIKGLDLRNFDGNVEGNYIDFYYVYHFKVKFNKGENIIKHTYSYDLSGSIDYDYDFEYVLTAANRWANKQIDDFTLILDMGDFQSFAIKKSFFKSSKDWKLEGIGNSFEIKKDESLFHNEDASGFYIKNGNIVFTQKNFKPEGELFVYNKAYLQDLADTNLEDLYLPFSISQTDNLYSSKPVSNKLKTILRNLPFARRGNVFKDPSLNRFFSKMPWYFPDENYIPDLSKLTKDEITFIKKWK